MVMLGGIVLIHGVGVDVLSVKRLEPLMRDLNDPFFQVYTPAERAEAEAAAAPLLYYAERFAAKEAVFKALRMDSAHVRLNEIETLHGKYGEPYVALHGWLKQYAEENGVGRIHISISNDTPIVVAYAVCESVN